jgi:hypothetical protein
MTYPHLGLLFMLLFVGGFSKLVERFAVETPTAFGIAFAERH